MRSLFAALALCALAVPAAAQSTPAATDFELSWTAPDGCPTAAEFRAEVAKLASGDLSQMKVSVSIERRGDRFELELTARQGDSSGQRQLSDPSCLELARAGAVVLAIAVVPALAPDPEPSPQPTPPVAAKPEGPADSENPNPARRFDTDTTRIQPTRAAPGRFRASVRTDAAVVTGVLPGPAPGLAAAVGLSRGRVRGEAIGWLLFEQEKRVSVGADVLGGDFDALAIGGRVCVALVHRPAGGASFEACGGVELLQLRGVGVGVDSPLDANDELLSFETGVAVAVPIAGRLTLRSGLSGLLYPKRSIYELTTTTPGMPPAVVRVHETAAISGRLTIGLGLSL